MKLTVNNLGILQSETTFELGDFTVLTGCNNTGKTYAMYLLWALLKKEIPHEFSFVEKLTAKLQEEGTLRLDFKDFFAKEWAVFERGLAEGLRKQLPSLFSAPNELFSNTSLKLSLDPLQFVQHYTALVLQTDTSDNLASQGDTLDIRVVRHPEPHLVVTALNASKIPATVLNRLLNRELIGLLLAPLCQNPFLLPAERGGLHLFYQDLDAKNAAFLRHIKREESNNMELIRDLIVAQYAKPIEEYIQTLKLIPRLGKRSGLFHEQALKLQKDIVNIRYKVNKEGLITGKPYRSEHELAIHLTSSTVKSFYGLWAWLELIARPGDCLMIDEPELNLHPDNQRLITRLLVRLAQLGIRVIISTHSDHIIRELNNMAMLASDFPERKSLEKDFGYDADGAERISIDRIRAYHFTPKGCEPSLRDPSFGIEVESIDQSISSLNRSNAEIYFALQEQFAKTNGNAVPEGDGE